ncbi:MAG: hypothetical protein JNK65_04250 [Deltaproteobacteria bacterium]|nr:hypothetical protein [Deltaproteobacteria bacterium]
MQIVEWSHEDNCYIGTAPGLILGGVHGQDELEVFKELSDVVGEALRLLKSKSALS